MCRRGVGDCQPEAPADFMPGPAPCQARKTSKPELSSSIFSGGVGVFHVHGWGPKNSVCPSKPGESNFLGGIFRDFAGISRRRPKSLRKKNWCSIFGACMAEMADAVEAAEVVAPAPPLTKASPPQSMRTASIDETPTEPATSPRMMEVPVQLWAEELQLPTGQIGPREEPERYATRFIVNDGTWTPAEHEEILHKAAQGCNYRDWNRERREAEQNYGRKKNMNEVSRNGKPRSRAEPSSAIHVFHVVHLQRKLRPCVFFPMFMKPSGRMILLGLHGHSQSSRKLLHLQEDRGQTFSFLKVNLQGLVQPQCSLHHHPSLAHGMVSLKVCFIH